jgi:DNA sulfur modification protein DndD
MLDAERTLAPKAMVEQIEHVSRELGFNPTFLDRVLDLRGQFARDGNRRRLFAALDDLVSQELPDWTPKASPASKGVIRLTRLTLRNWKVFETAELLFPDHDPDRPVVLIGGKNGYGKTSLLEALHYGLFGGAAALDPLHGEAGAAPRNTAYRTFIERALHRPARERGEGMASVRSEWETPEGRLAVERRWYFDDELRFTPDDETLTLWDGDDLRPVVAPADVNPAVFYQQELERRLLPASLAPFVFFDGEQVKRFAERRFSDQVRLAAEAVMGLSEWREAAADLRAYARDRAKGQSRADADLEAIASELLALEADDAGLADQLADVDWRRSEPRQKRDHLLAQLAPLQSGTYASLHELLERQQTLTQDLARARHEFATAASNAAPLAFLPAALVARVGAALRSELEHDRPWRDLFGDAGAREVFLAALATEAGAAAPVITEAAGRAWDRLGATPAEAGALRHDYLGLLRARVLQSLSAGPDLARVAVAADRLVTLEAEAAELLENLAANRQRDEGAAAIRDRLGEVTAALAHLDGEAAGLKKRQNDLRGRLERLRQQTLATVRPPAAPADHPQRALHAALSIERLVEAVRPLSFAALGHHTTEAYRAIAHKRLVEEVRVAADGEVSLLDTQGRDVLGFEASAGESQIFAMALLAAVGDLSAHRLPLVIDTPLGRLDPEHRERILQYFSHRPYQTVLLSQPDEVNGRYLAMIEGKVAGRFRLDHAAAASGGPGGSVPTPNAYPELAA